MKRQETGWGYIDWLENTQAVKTGVLRVGIVVIGSHKHMPAHIHFDEQIIYTFQGSGYSIINGQRINMSVHENNLLHWMPGVIHEMYNTEDVPYVHLMVTCSDFLDDAEAQKEDSNHPQVNFQESVQYLYAVIDEIRNTFLKDLRYSFMIYDAFGNVTASSRLFPKYCKKHCGESVQNHTAYCMERKHRHVSEISDATKAVNTFLCPGGLTILSVPIIFRGNRIGYIEGGYVYTGEISESDPDLYLAPFSSVENIWITLKRIARMISNYCELHFYQTDRDRQERQLDFERRDREILEADLKKTESSLIDLKINNHFLFNTLNQMAAMALDGGMPPLYRSIIDLSKMFQYTVRQNSLSVTLAQELDYLDAYLRLQKLRYGNTLTIEYEIKANTENWRVPFNWLVPIAENAFTHGFKGSTEKRLRISMAEMDNWLETSIENSGTVPDSNTLRALRIRMRGEENHGLAMIYRKMSRCYGHKFIMDIQTVKGGTAIVFSLPKMPDTAQERESKI